jgi:hypothetical protein
LKNTPFDLLKNTPFDLLKFDLSIISPLSDILIFEIIEGASVYDVVHSFEKASGVKIPLELAGRRQGCFCVFFYFLG